MTDVKFLAKINKRGGKHPKLKTHCWTWTGYVARDGYGIIRYNRDGIGAHRRSWEVHVGPVPEGLFVLHKCDNRKCVNPKHLFVGTCNDNIRDRDEKGRQVKGEGSHLSKLTEAEVIEIRKEYDLLVSTGRVPFKQLAKRFGISTSQIRHIGKRWCWKHVPEEVRASNV